MLHLHRILCLRSLYITPCKLKVNRLFTGYPKYYAKRSNNEDEQDNKPINYSKSPASSWRAETSRIGYSESRLWYEPYVIMVCLAVFLLYFCILREENDVDAEFGTALIHRVKGLEEQQLRVVLEYNKEKGLDTKDIIDRLNEIEMNKTKQL